MTDPATALRVLRLVPYFDWPGAGADIAPDAYPAIGGIQRQALRLTLALADLGISQTVVALPMPGGPQRLWVRDGVEVRGSRGRVPAVMGKGVRGPIGEQLEWIAGLRAAIDGLDADLIHVHSSCAPWPLLGALRVNRKTSLPIVATVHCSSTATYHPRSRRDRAFQIFVRGVERAALGRCAHTIVLAERLRDRLVETGVVVADSVTVIPDAVDVGASRALASDDAVRAFRQRFGLLEDVPLAAYVGRIGHEKGWPALAEVAEHLRASGAGRLLICGGGEDGEGLAVELERRGLTGTVTLTGPLDADDVPAALRCAATLVLPSIFEELGSVLIEALALGVPAVAYDVGGISEVVRGEVTGLLAPAGDTRALSAAVARLLTDPKLATRFGAEGMREAGRYDLASAAARIADIYRRVTYAAADARPHGRPDVSPAPSRRL